MGDDLYDNLLKLGIPMKVAELAAKFKKSEARNFCNGIGLGKIGFKDVKDVLFSLTNGKVECFQLNGKTISTSLSGKISNLEDALGSDAKIRWEKLMKALLNDAIDGLASCWIV